MTGGPAAADRAAGARWTASLLLILGLHAAAVVLVARREFGPAPVVTPADPIMLDLTPELAAAVAVPVPAAQPALPAPEPAPEPAIAPQPDVASPAEPEPPPPPQAAELARPALLPPPFEPPRPAPERRPVPRMPPPPARLPAVRRAAPPEPDARALAPPSPGAVPASPTAPVAAPPAANPQAVASWRSLLLGRLQAAKRYPEGARADRDEGTAVMRFTLDRAGRVLSAALVRSSGFALLDEEAAALLRRAEPFPAPPADMQGATLTFTVPVSFALR